MTEFTPIASLVGGMLIGLSAALLVLLEGRIAGISGIAVRLLPPWRDGLFAQRLAFVAGLVAAPLLVSAVTGTPVVQTVSADLALMAVAGLLVGCGSVWGGGCTSGHGVCGMARLSPRSAVATLVFMSTGFLTVLVMRHVLGG
ncbi:YeeE/YedE family protein [Ancylobacter dichloromethanicus]|uniref:Membrane protein n=2 Tax=Ancylobacter dichloromethanicus TaxID=518825 RepID=A0A9W6JBP3_9HYPH|nr:YeeE/YedE family protein [Ancylobacter dichloromethanicus]MBS7552946.1 YeeE/YedE family protein [Ancylobacter dichloromethanicus]GLK74551.1 membrane protein [Ancylobacter dichloromethanicus]